MTKFTKDNLSYHGGYLTYVPYPLCPHTERKFVARFKHVPSNRAGFVSFLKKNFTVEEYFAAMENDQAPMTILEAKGYIPAHIQKWIEQGVLKEWKGVVYA